MDTYILVAMAIAIVVLYLRFELLKSKLSGIKVKNNVIVLKDIPKEPETADVDAGYKTLRDVMESAKLEKWDYEVKLDHSKCYDINMSNHSKEISLRIRLRMSDDSSNTQREGTVTSPYISIFTIQYSIDGERDALSYGSDEHIANELILFTWEFILDYHEKRNLGMSESYKKSIDLIQSRLITLNRDRKLNSII
jgi:hypothetical protein